MSQALHEAHYVADHDIATAVYLAYHLNKPVLVEGPAGVGKTELAKACATALDTDLIRLQCYEGLDEAKTIYEWQYAKQLLYSQMLRDNIAAVVGDAPNLAHAVERIAAQEDAFFSERFLTARPLLRALRAPHRVVLLIDEVDRAGDELEAFFLETLGEFQITIPELGTIRAAEPPLVFVTSNNRRDLSDALRRRCLYLPLDYPPPEKEAAVLQMRVPGLQAAFARELSDFVAATRELDLRKKPGIAESVDWARGLLLLHADHLEDQVLETTLNLLAKFEDDLNMLRDNAERIRKREPQDA